MIDPQEPAMTYSDAFAAAVAQQKPGYDGFIPETKFTKGNIYTLRITSQDYNFYNFNFLLRLLEIRVGTGSSSGGVSIVVVPFKDIDREVLEEMRNKLIELGGTPPHLPEEKNPFSLQNKAAAKPTARGAL